jgi:indole-3-glycerol phosphate synthase
MKRLARFAEAARERAFDLPPARARAPSLARALARPGIVAELKPGSPTEGPMRALDDPTSLAKRLLDAGAAGLSALTEPTEFGGSPALLAGVAAAGGPTLMKDFVVTERQLDLAQRAGASAVLLILPLLTKEHAEWASPDDAIGAAHARGLEVLLEVYDDEEFLLAGLLDADMVGVNNRDLRDDDLPVDATRTVGILARCGPIDAPVLALSGARSASDIREQVAAGARGVLVGTALMRAEDPVAKLRELMEGLK